MKMNKKDKDTTKNKWDYFETLVDKANEVLTEPKRYSYIDSDNSDAYVSKEESQKRISFIFISLALLLNIVVVCLIVLESELTIEDQVQMTFHDNEGNIIFLSDRKSGLMMRFFCH